MEKAEKQIREFHARVTEIERVTDAMNSFLSMTPESVLNAAIWALVGGYTDAIDAAYNIGGWLEWWWLECRLGKNPMQAGLAGEELRTISTIDDLVRLICDDIAKTNNAALTGAAHKD